MKIDLTSRDNLIGIALMILAMAGFAVEDGMLKYMAGYLPIGQVLVLLGIGGTLAFYILARTTGAVFSPAVTTHPAVILRSFAELFGTVFFVTSLTLAPITLLSAIIQVTPLLVTLGAALFLGEKVGIRRWSAIAIGLFGVMIIIRPDTSGANFASLFAVLGVIGLAARDVATRRVPKDAPTYVLATLGFSAVIPAGLILSLFAAPWQPVSAGQGGYIGLMVLVGLFAYFCIISAMRRGEVSAITPFRYSRLIFGAIIGMIFFAESIDRYIVIGSAIIITSGLYSLWSETRLANKK